MNDEFSIKELIEFRLEANKVTSIEKKNKVPSTRFDSGDHEYTNGPYTYHDTYVGGSCFAGQEAIWYKGEIKYVMNYMARIIDHRFRGDFLLKVLIAANRDMPFRGPKEFEADGYKYVSEVQGDISWFQGHEEVFYDGDIKVYECYFSGCLTKSSTTTPTIGFIFDEKE